jgi:hypothetical protein
VKRILTVAAREAVDTLRDRRTMLVTLATASLAGPIHALPMDLLAPGESLAAPVS